VSSELHRSTSLNGMRTCNAPDAVEAAAEIARDALKGMQ
jgi:hypothetical protein